MTENGRGRGEFALQKGEKGGSRGDLGTFLAHLMNEDGSPGRIMLSVG